MWLVLCVSSSKQRIPAFSIITAIALFCRFTFLFFLPPLFILMLLLHHTPKRKKDTSCEEHEPKKDEEILGPIISEEKKEKEKKGERSEKGMEWSSRLIREWFSASVSFLFFLVCGCVVIVLVDTFYFLHFRRIESDDCSGSSAFSSQVYFYFLLFLFFIFYFLFFIFYFLFFIFYFLFFIFYFLFFIFYFLFLFLCFLFLLSIHFFSHSLLVMSPFDHRRKSFFIGLVGDYSVE